MLLTLPQLKDLLVTLEKARLGAPAAGQGDYCDAPVVSEDGATTRWVPKPRSRQATGYAYPDGTKLEERNGEKGINVPLGVHGRSFLAVDPKTGNVRCAACERGKK